MPETDNCSLLLNLALGVGLWTATYQIVRKYFSDKNPEFSSRIVAAIHALIVTPMSYFCYKEGPNPFQDGGGNPNTELQIKTMTISLSYFIYDFGWCAYFGTEPVIMLVHHFCSISSIGLVLAKEESGAEAVIGLGSMEASNPCLQLRWFLRSAGYNNTPIHTITELGFLIIFIILRLGLGTKLTYVIVMSPDVAWDVKLCTLSLYTISLGFIYYMYQFFKRKYLSRSENKLSVDDEFKKDK